ncbi:hypothetical protein H9639_14330 [Arthrobacter sp. Sa2CUA1]|uniref:Uncharacterized protein n=1 Tax=Arthrobacter gallicola TaxID=2762225 RepID=A0ABR8UV95_9MICC|nr:hypothetical protein [Arthrobacter gallicola]MBD7996474.1 hypothetical protein [Arthrobacter gallicola]
MGNHTPSEDYRLYARPRAGQTQDPVPIVDGGGSVPSAVGQTAGNDEAEVLTAGRAGGRAAAVRSGGRSVARAGDRAARQHPVGASGGSGTSGCEDGSALAGESIRIEEVGNPGRSEGDRGAPVSSGLSASHGLSASDGPRRWFNPYLCAAWVLVAVMLAAGLFWLTGALEPPRYVSVDPATGQGMESGPSVIASNLYGVGPFLLLLGLIGALTLLTVQADGFRRGRGR